MKVLRLPARPNLRVRPLPEPEAAANYAWREGFWNGLSIGIVLCIACAVIAWKA